MTSEDLAGKTAIVSGGARGIGEAHCRALAAAGATVIIGDVLREEGEALARELGDRARFAELDVTDREQWAECVGIALGAGTGTLDILVNNAGINQPTPIEKMPAETWDRVLQINLTGHFNGIQAVIPAMRESGGGSIVNTASITAVIPPSQLAPYVASKMAIVGLTQIAALELGQYGIRVNALQPGYTDTPMMKGGDEAAITSAMPIRRYGRPEEVADMMLYLVTRATYTTGSVLPVDGGAVAGVGYAVD
ncbi:SDR family oxidoreductase [Microbacterium sp. YMB-B2]|uniref:SDR family oxidoreductase n=1 Tax=Microbacterium tenebrionis TaxID=2830665 RepID=A0A9X1LQF2_9MICO|nr:SDR family NAD(P)-dependent oxidoreductase [Microbacterium tenebrionis]MCC2030064.1 SDR family oxidoreductase [Microbacterium tenebrionis]